MPKSITHASVDYYKVIRLEEAQCDTLILICISISLAKTMNKPVEGLMGYSLYCITFFRGHTGENRKASNH